MSNLEEFAKEVAKDVKRIETNYATKQEMQEVAEKKQDKDTAYNDAEVKQRLTVLENRPTGGGSQKRDTGWITIKDGNDETGNILKIRRIEDMVHVQISNKSEYGLTIKGGYLGYNFAGYSLPTIGFNTPTSILLPTTKSPQHIEDNPSHIDVLGQAIFNVKNGELTMNVFTNSGQEQEDEIHINSFSYFTEDLFPTD
ncbi:MULTISPECIES: hypothetical protein [unclassified Streptococcus]|uniref:hypothetical protein n=1 Tax=unclassified Streptococcus TaxID=2608887 RepID=UPI0020C83575|nr:MULTISPECIES: hypothetical protein [unclassified Streptococcus]MCP9060375.1 hypothetical protein [Streptococcus sp. CF7_Ac1-12]MCP9084956.1 hypothetical protein [Streptococcus sp. CF7_Ac1-8]